VNETTGRWRSRPSWAERFDESDRLLVDALVRRAAEADPGVLPLTANDDDALEALLQLARSLRLDHVALALDPEALAGYLRDHDAPGAGEGPAAAARLINALTARERPLMAALVELVDLADPVARTGAPLLVSHTGGRAVFAHLRRLAHAEWRLADALLAAREPIGTLGGLDAEHVGARLGQDPPAAAVARAMVRHRLSVVTGGPGTGKTTAVARALQSLGDELRSRETSRTLTVALCAPTAKAAVRLREALDGALGERGASLADYGDVLRVHERSGSVHRLLGLRPDRATAEDPLDAELVIVDEASMLELPLLDQLVARARTDAHVVLVGDPDQLASVNVGAALRDLVDAAGPGGPLEALVTRLTLNHRSAVAIGELAAAVNAGDAAAVAAVAAAHPATVSLSDDRGRAERAVRAGALELVAASRLGVAPALDQLRRRVVLCATREGPGSVAWWRQRIESEVRAGSGASGRFAPGTPVLVTRNEPAVRSVEAAALSNGDVGVALGAGDLVAFGPPTAPRTRRAHELHGAEPAWAITIHKSQGSEYDEVVVSLPSVDTPLLTRELVYTAVTRARERVVVLADAAVLGRSLQRRIARVSGLGERVAARARLTPRDAHH
jgi:exodeoxyribonuclease V alpha subunit